MKHIAKSFLAVALVVVAQFGCGPEKSQLDLERENKAERTKQKAEENARLVGSYEGQLISGETVLGVLHLDIYPRETKGSQIELDPTFLPILNGLVTGYIPGLVDDLGLITTTAGEDNFPELIADITYDGGSKVIIESVVKMGKESSTASFNGAFNGSNMIDGTFFAPGGLKIKGVGTVLTARIVFKKK